MPSMAYLSSSVLVLFFLLLVSGASGRGVPVAAAANKKVEKVNKECLDQEGSVLIPGIGRYMKGSHEGIPSFIDLDHSGPAAVSGHYIPGNDDTFVPNPGFEVPNPARGAVSP
uniref:LLA-115 n=1 Tax=Lilium longiflorum TaxID=4690 RepID=B2BA79_LILLO|nr:LLA-115 [Lilium longiflorum]ACD93462.1 tapetum-specific protein LLA-115 [Lilium longiflorum]